MGQGHLVLLSLVPKSSVACKELWVLGGELACAGGVLQLHINICLSIRIHGSVIRNLAQVGGIVIKMSGCFICSQERELSFSRVAWSS